MEFLDYKNNDSRELIAGKHENYREYLLSNRAIIPAEAYEFAMAEWHYDPTDHRCPHDSWVESLQILEVPQPAEDKKRVLEIRLSLLGAYHDGRLELKYEGVKAYDLKLAPTPEIPSVSHGDWLIDEVRLSPNGFVLHEIKFWLGGTWVIECQNISSTWHADGENAGV